MSERDQNYWYYNINGHEQGPVMGSRLRQMARRGKLISTDLIRQGKFGQWVEAGTVEEVGARPQVITPEISTTDEPVTSVANVRVNRFGEWINEWKCRVSDLVSDSRYAVVTRFDLLRTIASYLALIAILGFLTFRTIDWSLFQRRTAADPLAYYQSAWDKLQLLRQKKADPKSWSDFANTTREELKPIIARLEQLAGSTNRDAQLLLWAGRDCLPRMVDDARIETSSSERQFVEYLENVELLRLGKPIYGGKLRSAWDFGTWDIEWVIRNPGKAWLAMFVPLTSIVVCVWIGTRFRKSSAVK